MKNEALARVRINDLLKEAGWRFFDDENGSANILLENKVKITQKTIDEWGQDYEKTKNGSLDFLLVDSNGKPVCVLEAKKESIHPLAAKEQARKYAKTVEAKFVILSNGIVHYLWDIRKGNPKPIRNCIYFRYNKYGYFKLMKRSGGFRELMTPDKELKFIQNWILENILSKYPLNVACCGFRKNYSIVSNAKVHEKAKYIMKVDLLKFYDTITEKQVFKIFASMGYLPNLAVDLAKLTTSHHRKEYWDRFDEEEKTKLKYFYEKRPPVLPQGSPTSPMLSNIAATNLDKRLTGLSKANRFNYSRYADDLTFSADNLLDLPNIDFIRRIIAEEGFFVNDKKTLFSKRGMKQYVTGLTITHGVHVSKRYRREILTHLYFSKKHGPQNHLKAWTKRRKLKRDFNAFQDWLLGSIWFIYSVDKINGKKMLNEFNKINWTL
ncbi:MAG: reverse transcriptase domain-containing protein [Cyclobacteriaceae bacterium]